MAYYFPFRHNMSNLDLSYKMELKELIESKVCVFHNAKFDIVSLATIGIYITGKFYCTLLMAHWVNENLLNKGLDWLAKHICKVEGKDKSKLFTDFIKLYGWGMIPPMLMAEYAAQDAYLVYVVFKYFYAKFVEQGFDGELWEIEQEFIRLIQKMEATGVLVDLEKAKAEVIRGEARMAEITKELGLNPGSTKDLRKLILEDLKLPVKKLTPNGQPSMDKEAMRAYELILERENNPTAKLILEYRGYQKAVSSYWRSYLKLISPDGRVRPNYKLHGTKTGRLSCEEPNLQQIPKVTDKVWNREVKSGFVAQDDFDLWEADYAQLELRLGAAYAREEKLIEVFEDDSRDIFTEMSTDIGMDRFDTKTTVYTIQYGGGATRLSDVFGISLNRGAGIKENFFNTYPGFAKVTELASNRCRQQGFITLWSGRRRHFQWPKDEAHKAFNSAMQGGAAEIVKRAMLRVAKEVCDENCRMLLQVHDSIVFEIRKGMETIYGPKIVAIMNDVQPDFGVRFKTDFHHWGD